MLRNPGEVRRERLSCRLPVVVGIAEAIARLPSFFLLAGNFWPSYPKKEHPICCSPVFL
jgi:hypothetical protein